MGGITDYGRQTRLAYVTAHAALILSVPPSSDADAHTLTIVCATIPCPNDDLSLPDDPFGPTSACPLCYYFPNIFSRSAFHLREYGRLSLYLDISSR